MQTESTLTLDRIFKSDEFKAKTFGPARWLEDDVGYTTLEPPEGEIDDKKLREIVRYDILSGERSILVSVKQLIPDGADKPLIIDKFSWSPDKKRLLIFTNSKRVWRVNSRGDYWALDLESGDLKQLGGVAKPSTLMFAKFSPDNQSVAYVRENNIYVESIDSGAIVQLTDDGSETIINGTSDWVYEEEFRLRDGFRWSPDSQSIAYWQFDTQGIEPFYMINNTDSLYPKLIPLPYPKVGSANAACRVGTISAKGGETNWIDAPGDLRQHYIPKMDWAANSEQVVIQQLNRLQNCNKVMLGNAADGRIDVILVEEDEAWIDLHDDLKWLGEGEAFTWISDRDGWRRLYRVSRDGQDVILLTPGEFDVISIQKIDTESGWVYFIASPDNPAQRYLYRVSLSGNGRTELLTPADMPGTHAYQIAPNAKWAFHTFSTFESPPVVTLISLPDHLPVRVLEDNRTLREKVAAINRVPVEFFRVTTEENVAMDGWLIKPPDFDSSQHYPLLFYVYGEPAGQTVLDRWGEKRYLWYLMLAQMGYLVMSVDNRGTPAPRGRAWRKYVYRQVGILTTDDQAAAARVILRERPYI